MYVTKKSLKIIGDTHIVGLHQKYSTWEGFETHSRNIFNKSFVPKNVHDSENISLYTVPKPTFNHGVCEYLNSANPQLNKL